MSFSARHKDIMCQHYSTMSDRKNWRYISYKSKCFLTACKIMGLRIEEESGKEGIGHFQTLEGDMDHKPTLDCEAMVMRKY